MVKGVAFANIFNAKIINNKAKHKRTTLVDPESRSEGALVVVMGLVAFLYQIVGKGDRPGKAIDSIADFKINPAFKMYVVV